MSIAERIKYFRNKRNLTISECAGLIGVSQSTFRDWENGRAISGEPYLKISEMFGISLSELFGLELSQAIKELNEVEIELDRLKNHVKLLKSRL